MGRWDWANFGNSAFGMTDWQQLLEQQPSRWLVSGAAGFIGSHLVDRLLRQGQSVIGLDNLSSGRREYIDAAPALAATHGGEWAFVEGDVCNYETCVSACEGVDFVLHQAALVSVADSFSNPRQTHRVNVNGHVNMLLAAQQQDVRRTVYASSCAVYGDCQTLPLEEAAPLAPKSPYGLSKQVAEQYSELYFKTLGIESVGLRYFNVVGPRQSATGGYAAVVPSWVEAIRRGSPPIVHGDGKTTRDFCPVENVVQANIRAALTQGPVAGRVYNIGQGEQTSLLQLLAALSHAASVPVKAAQFTDFRAGDIRFSQAAIERAKAELGYRPEVSLVVALQTLFTDAATERPASVQVAVT